MNTSKEKRIKMDKNRAAWLSWRKNSIGSSDAAAVHNESPYMTPLELYEEKFINKEIKENDNYILERGRTLEPIARKLFAAEYNMANGTDETFDPENFQLSDAIFMTASSDGASKDKKIGIEIKFQGAEAHEAVKDGKIARHYWIQIQHQILVCGFEYVYLVSYNPKAEVNKIYFTLVRPDKEFLQKHIEACAQFWANGIKGVAPKETKDDFVTMKKAGMSEKAKRVAELKEQIDTLIEEMDSLKDEILAAVIHPKTRIGPLRFSEVERVGAVDFKKIPELKGVDLELYRKASSKYFKMTVEE